MRTLLRLAGCTLMLALPVVSSVSGTSPLPLTPFRLGPVTTYPAQDSSNGDVAIGDLNGDGRPDLVVGNYFPDTIEVRLNQGLGVFGPAASYPVATSPTDIELADVNGDGRLDVLVAPQGGVRLAIRMTQPGIAVLRGNGDGTLQPQIFSPLANPLEGFGTGPTTIAVGDMNGDGHPDAVVNRFKGFGPSPWFETLFEFDVALGDGTGAFTVASRTAGGAAEVQLGDFDRDGNLDVVAISGESSLYRGNGTGGLFAGTPIYNRANAQIHAGDIGDLNGDGLLDIVLTTHSGLEGELATLVALLGNGNGTFRTPTVKTMTGERSLSTRIADMDRDGIADVVHEDDLNDGPRALLVSLGRGDGTFQTAYAHQLPGWAYRLDVGDLDGNGLFDIAVVLPNIGVAVVLDGSDRTLPVLTLPSTMTVEADRPVGAVVSYSASASDNLDGPVTPVCAPASGAVFPVGDTTVSCSATDLAGNQAQGSFHVIVRDTTRPVLTVPALITAEATGPAGAVVTFAATATDIVNGAIAPICAPASGAVFPLGDTTVSCSAIDAAGNQSDDVFHVIVRDTTAPQLTVPADITANATVGTTSLTAAIVTFNASATDLVDGAVIPVCTPASGSQFALGATTVSCTATDARGNTSAPQTFTVTVRVPEQVDLFEQLIAASTGVGPGKSLVNKALEARAVYQAGNRSGACSILADYLNEVRAQSGKKLTVAQAAMLTDLAVRVRGFVGC
jgi:hypothetical protein